MDQDVLNNSIKYSDDLLIDGLINNEERDSAISLLANINKLNEIEGKKLFSLSNPTSKSSVSLKESKELLGSVTTFTPTCGPDSGHTVRTSARVIQKMRLDSIRPPTPPIAEKKDIFKEEKPGPKTPNQIKSSRNAWTHTDTIFFFDALNEYGKDFESIAHYVNTKSKRKNSSNVTFKTRDQIRIFYYQSLQKVSKYLKFSDDVKKMAQELYALINYGEMRKKLIFVNEKSLMKLRDLVYKGWVTIRSKGRNIKIKTPSCKALRQLNQLEEWQEEIKLPPRIEVLMKPFNVETWGKVHSIAQNPRVKMTLPIQRRVSSILKTLQMKWKIQDFRLCDKSMTMQPNPTVSPIPLSENVANIRILPPPSAVIHRPMVNITEFLSSNRICLNSYEERIGVKVKGETLCSERINSLKEMMKTNSKRQRHDSNSEKKSPEFKKSKLDFDIKPLEPCEKLEIYLSTAHMFNPSSDCSDIVKSSGDEGDQCNDEDIKNDKYLSDNEDIKSESYSNSHKLSENCDSENDNEIRNEEKHMSPKDYKFEDSLVISKKKIKKSKKNMRKTSNYIKPLISEETMKLVREGWTLSNIGDITIGDLYVMFGNDLKLNLEYAITKNNLSVDRSVELPRDVSANISICGPLLNGDMQIETITIKTQNDKIENDRIENSLGTKLRQLILIANLMEQKKKKTSGCICGHNCERNVRLKKSDDFSGSFISNKTHLSNQSDNYVFRPPTLPSRNSLPVAEPYKHHATNIPINQQPINSKLLKLKNRQSFSSKQVVVKRILPLHPNNESLTLSDNKTLSSTMSSPPQQTQNNNFEIKVDTCTANPSQINSVSGAATVNVDILPSVKEPNTNNNCTNDTSDFVDTHLDMPDLENIQNNFVKKVDDDIKCLLDVRDVTSDNLSLDEKMKVDDQSCINMSLTTNSKETSLSHLNEDSSINTEWLTPDINDFSFSSFLGHLDNLAENSRKEKHQEENLDSNLSVISESSVDYMTKFAQITAELKEREYDGVKGEVNN